MEFRILGPLEVRAASEQIPVAGGKVRAALAMLVLHANEAVSKDRLAVALWGEEAPPEATRTVQVHVSRLRRALGDPGVLSTTPAGYRLRIAPGELDAERFQALVEEGRQALSAREPGRAATLLRDALALWRGPPLAEFAFAPFAQAAITRLEEGRLAAVELRVEANLAAGSHGELVAELAELIALHPLRERLRGHLMLALYRCGRQADALEAYREARRTLVEEVGVEPGPELRRLHDAILRHDPALELELPAAGLPMELEVAARTPLVGRAADHARLRGLWQATRRSGTAAAVALIGGRGLGKTRLAAELAREVHPHEGAVLYVAGGDPASVVLSAVAQAEVARRATLLVIDDLDRADRAVGEALAALPLGRIPVLLLATAENEDALAPLPWDATLVLEPLDAESVTEIAVLYTSQEAAAVSATRLLQASRGVPRRVHEVAAEWTRLEAALRVDAAAGRAAASRSELRGVQTELASNVVDLQLVRERAELLAGVGSREQAVVCPFKGLAAFDFDDAEYFCGRERVLADLVARMVGAPLIGLVGASGSGKTSLLHAGLLPALAGGVLPGRDQWSSVVMRPGAHPMSALRRAASGLVDNEPAIIAVDQFEETFTACTDERERREFIDTLTSFATGHDQRTVTIVAVRADFYSRCAAYPDFSELLTSNHLLVGPMRREELRRAISQPAVRAGLRIEAELVDALVADVEDEPGGLPLLSTALLELWQRREGNWLRCTTYERTGGLHGAVARLAEDAFAQLDERQQRTARRVFGRLAAEDPDGALVRRRVPLVELERSGDVVAGVIAVLTERRLLTTSADSVEVAHEALLCEWPRLRAWLDEDAEGRRLHRRLADSALAWDDGGRASGDLYRGATLAAAAEWRAAHNDELSEVEATFLDAGRAESERAHRRLVGFLAGAVLLSVIALLGVIVALHQRGTARAEARAAEAQRLGTEAMADGDLARSLLVAREGMALDNTLATRSNLLSTLSRTPAAIGVFHGEQDLLDAVDVAPTGELLAAGDGHGRVIFFDPQTRRRAGRSYVTRGFVISLRFSPDGSRLAVEARGTKGTHVDLVDVHTRRAIAAPLAGKPQPVQGDLIFSPDSGVLTATFPASIGSSNLLRWSARTGRALRAPKTIGGTTGDALVGYVGDGSELVTQNSSNGRIGVRDAATLRPLRRLARTDPGLVGATNRRLAAIGDASGGVTFVDVRTGTTHVGLGRHDGAVWAMRFTLDGRRLVTVGEDGRVIVWRAGFGEVAETFDGHTGPMDDVAISRDSRTAYTASESGGVIAWNLAGAGSLRRRFAVGFSDTTSVPVTPGGKHFLVADAPGQVSVFDSRTLERVRRIRVWRRQELHMQPMEIALSPDGHTVATVGDGKLAFWSIDTGRRLGRPLEPDLLPGSPAFEAHGGWLVTSLGDHHLGTWDLRTRRLVARRKVDGIVRSVAASAGSSLVATSVVHKNDVAGAVEILSLPDLKPVKRLDVVSAGGVGIDFSPDAKLVAIGGQGSTRLFETRTWRAHGRALVGHSGAVVLRAVFSPDGRTLVTTGTDGTARLWDVASQHAIGAELPVDDDQRVGAAFVLGGMRLITVSTLGRGFAWDLRPEVWLHQACAIAGRVLTRAEWADVLPQRDYAPACR